MAYPHNRVAKPQKNPYGVTNSWFNSTLHNYPAMDPTWLAEYWEDFNSNSDISAATPLSWTITSTGTSVITMDSTAADGIGGRVKIATGSTSGNNCEAQLKVPSLLINTKFRAYYEILLRVSNVATTDLLVGLQPINTTPTAANTEGVYFRMTTGSAPIVAKVASGSATTTSGTLVTAVASTDYRLGFEFDPWKTPDNGTVGTSGAIRLYLNGQPAGASTALPITNIPATNLLAPVIFIQTNTAASANVIVDYILASQERPWTVPTI